MLNVSLSLALFFFCRKRCHFLHMMQYMRTYLPLNSDDDGKGVVNEIVKVLAKVLRKRTGKEASIVDVDLIVKDNTGGVSTIYNKLGLGKWHSPSSK